MTLDDMLCAAEDRHLTLNEIAAYCAQSNASASNALDTASRVVARRYLDGNLSFGVGDVVMTSLFGYGAQNGVLPDLMHSVFLAFDAGEFYPDNIREPSPEERFTRAQVAKILANDSAS
jgi:hypothetical protein